MAEDEARAETINSSLQLLRNVSISELVYEQVHGKILSGEILPGQHINEYQLATALGVSRASLREACRQLQKDGLVDIAKNKGPFVRDLPLSEAIELYDVRASLEATAAEMAAANRTDSELADLAHCVDNLDRLMSSANEAGLFAEAVKFHRIVANMSRNESLKEILKVVSARISLFRRRIQQYGLGEPDNTDEKLIYAAIERKDGKKAAELMRTHILRGKAKVVKVAIEYLDTGPSKSRKIKGFQ